MEKLKNGFTIPEGSCIDGYRAICEVAGSTWGKQGSMITHSIS